MMNETLNSDFNYANLNEENSALVEGMIQKLKRKEILDNHKPPIRQLSNGCWYTRVNGHRIERKNKTDVENALIKAYKEQAPTINKIFNDFIDWRKMELADTTWSKYITYYERYIKGSNIADKPIASLELFDGYDFIKHCLRINPSMKKKYWKNINTCLNQIFLYSIEKGFIDKNPFTNLRPKNDLFEPATVTREEDTVFTKQERIIICKIATDEAIKKCSSIPLGIVLLFNLGLRIGELCALKWGDIQTDIATHSKYIHIHSEIRQKYKDNGKTDGFELIPHCKTKMGERLLPLNKQSKEMLKLIRELNIKSGFSTNLDDFIFVRTVNKQETYCTPRSFDPKLRRYCKLANMSCVKSSHDIRRTVITELFNAKVPAKEIQAFAGHSTFEQTLKYVRRQSESVDLVPFLDMLAEEPDENPNEIAKMFGIG